VALTLTSIIVVLVSTVFLAQNNFFSRQVATSAAQDNARSVTEYIASDVRSLMQGGVVTASHHDLVIHSPIAVGVVCAHAGGNKVSLHLDGGLDSLDTDEISGFAVRDSTTGEWAYYDVDKWNKISTGTATAAADCAANGADTVGAYDDFMRLNKLDSYVGPTPPVGTILMLYRNVEFEYKQSDMDSTTWGLFRGIHGDTLLEFATGMDTTSGFSYRTGGSTYAASVTGVHLDSIDAIRVTAQAKEPAVTGGQSSIGYGWSTNLILRNGS
jgi:hypothetical protein